MMNTVPDLSFKPGAGEVPPVMAGREKEQSRIKLVLDRLNAGLSPGQNIALIGPRGNGKTVLLKWVKEQVGRCDGKIECVELIPENFESHHDLVMELTDPETFSARAFGWLSPLASLQELGVGLSRKGTAKKPLRHVLKKRCSKSGLAILIDESHKLYCYPNLAGAFFNDVQVLVGDGCPLLLILAGTPNMTKRLAAIEATFWSRTKKIGIGLLDDAAARDALRIPFERMGYSIKAAIVDVAAREAQSYPYFLQVVGDALHCAARKDPDKLGSGNEIGDEILEQALEELSERKMNCYEERYRELFDAGVLPAAETVARRFISQKEKSISAAAFEVSVSLSIDKKMEELVKKDGGVEPAARVGSDLRDFGFVWSQIGKEDSYEAGIPSLMNYVVERADEREIELRRIRELARSTPHSDENGFDDELSD